MFDFPPIGVAAIVDDAVFGRVLILTLPAVFATLLGPLQMLPLGEEDVISFSLLRSCFLNLARLFWNQT